MNHFSFRLSDDVPSQSESIPLINIYYIGCMFVSLMSLLWFSTTNYYRTYHPRLPQFAKWLTKKVFCPIFRIKPYKPIKGKWKKIMSFMMKYRGWFFFFKLTGDDDGKQTDSYDLTNLEMVDIMNDFVFYLFIFSVLLLNFTLLVFLPLFVKQPLTIS